MRWLVYGLLMAVAAHLLWLAAMIAFGMGAASYERALFLVFAAAAPTPWIGAVLFSEHAPVSGRLLNLMRAAVVLAQVAWVVGIWLMTVNPRLRAGRSLGLIFFRGSAVVGVVAPYTMILAIRGARVFPTFPVVNVLINLPAVLLTVLWLAHAARSANRKWLARGCLVLALVAVVAHSMIAIGYWSPSEFLLVAFYAIGIAGAGQFLAMVLLLWHVWRYKRSRSS